MFKKAKPLKNPKDSEHAYNYALFLLNLRLRTEGEMRKKMTDRGYAQSVIKEIIVKLQTDRFIDDERYIEIFIENMKSYKYYGYFMMKKKLIEKLLPKELIELKLEDLVTTEDELAIAKRYVEKEFGSLLSFSGKRSETRGSRLDSLSGVYPRESGGGNDTETIIKKLNLLPYEKRQKIRQRLASRGFRIDSISKLV